MEESPPISDDAKVDAECINKKGTSQNVHTDNTTPAMLHYALLPYNFFWRKKAQVAARALERR